MQTKLSLRYNTPEVGEPHVAGVQSINEQRTPAGLHHAEQHHHQRALAAACSTHSKNKSLQTAERTIISVLQPQHAARTADAAGPVCSYCKLHSAQQVQRRRHTACVGSRASLHCRLMRNSCCHNFMQQLHRRTPNIAQLETKQTQACAPVLPQMPTFSLAFTLKLSPLSTGGSAGL